MKKLILLPIFILCSVMYSKAQFHYSSSAVQTSDYNETTKTWLTTSDLIDEANFLEFNKECTLLQISNFSGSVLFYVGGSIDRADKSTSFNLTNSAGNKGSITIFEKKNTIEILIKSGGKWHGNLYLITKAWTGE